MYAGVKLLPERVISLPGDPAITGAIFTKDGSGVFILTHYDSLHIGRLLDATLPTWLGAICGLVMLWGIVRVIGVMRRKRDVGKMYCPGCNYCVSHDAGTLAVCAECGTDLTKRQPVPGQSTGRRVGIVVAAMIAPAICIYGGALLLVHTVGLFSHVDWRSARLGEKLSAQRNSAKWWSRGLGLSQTLYRADIATGELTRVGDYAGATFEPMTVHPITGDLYLRVSYDMLSLVDARTGAVKGRVDMGEIVTTPVDAPLTIDHDTDGRAYTQWVPWSRTGEHTVLGTWRAGDIAPTKVARMDESEGAEPKRYPRTFVTAADDKRRVVLALPHLLEVADTKRFKVHVFKPSDDARTYTLAHSVDLGTGLDNSQARLISVRENALLLTASNPVAEQEPDQAHAESMVRAYDLTALEQGEIRLHWTITLAKYAGSMIALSPDETMLYAQTAGGLAEIDIDKRGMQRLLSPNADGLNARAISVSAMHVLAEYPRPVGPTDAQGNPNRYTSDLYIWRVR